MLFYITTIRFISLFDFLLVVTKIIPKNECSTNEGFGRWNERFFCQFGRPPFHTRLWLGVCQLLTNDRLNEIVEFGVLLAFEFGSSRA